MPEKEEMHHERCGALLRECHRFPGPYAFKVIGLNAPDWENDAVCALRSALGAVDIECARRETGSGTYISLTLSAHVREAEDVMAAYAVLRALPGLKMLL